MQHVISGRYLFDNVIDFGKISNSFTQHLAQAGGFMTILPPGICTPADGQYIDMVFDTIVFDTQGDFIYYGNQDRMLEVYDARGGGWKDQSFRDIEFLPNTVVSDLLFTMLTECANNDDLPQSPRWQPKAKKIDLNKFLAEKITDPYRNKEFTAGQYYNVQVIAHSDNEYFDTSDPADTFEFKAAEPYNTDGGLYDENGANIVSWDTLTEFYEMAIHTPTEGEGTTGDPFWPNLESYAYKYNQNPAATDPIYYEPNVFWLGNIALTKFPEACTLVIPEGVTYVREHLLANISLGVSKLGGSNGLNITKLYLPSTIEKIGKDAFINSKITKIYYNGSAKSWAQIKFSTRYSNPCAAARLELMREFGFGLDGRPVMNEFFRYSHDRDNNLSPFVLLPDFYIKPTPGADYQPLVQIDVQGTQDSEWINISSYAFAGCGKYVERIILDNAVRSIGKDAFDVFIADNGDLSLYYNSSMDILPLSFYYNGTLDEWLRIGLTFQYSNKWSNPGYRARYIEFRDSEICGIDDEFAEVQCPIETLVVSLDSSYIQNEYAFAGWVAKTLILNFGDSDANPRALSSKLLKHLFFNTSFENVILDTTPEFWSRVGHMNSKSSNPLWRSVDYKNVFFYDNDLQTFVQADTTLYIPQRNTSVKAYKYASLPITKIYLPPSVQSIHRDAFFYCYPGIKLIDCTAYKKGLPKIPHPQSHPRNCPDSQLGFNFISSPFTSATCMEDRPIILIPRDRTGRDWEYLGSKSSTLISGEMNDWESCIIEHATSNLSTSTAINIKIYDVSATLSVRLKNIPGMTVDWGDGSLTYKSATSQLTDSEYITHTYNNATFLVQRGYKCDARTIRIYDIDHIPSNFFELNTDKQADVGIATLTIANGVKSVGKNAFGNTLNSRRLENIYISNTVLFIDQGAFGDYMVEDAYIVFEDSQNYSWYSTPQANTFTDSDECLSIDPLSCFDSYETVDGSRSQHSGMLSVIAAEGKVLYRYSAPKSYTIKIKTAVNGYMIDNGSSIIYNYPGEAQISIGKGAKNITATCTLGANQCSVKHDYNQTTGILTLTISGTASATNYMIKYSYSLPDYQKG